MLFLLICSHFHHYTDFLEFGFLFMESVQATDIVQSWTVKRCIIAYYFGTIWICLWISNFHKSGFTVSNYFKTCRCYRYIYDLLVVFCCLCRLQRINCTQSNVNHVPYLPVYNAHFFLVKLTFKSVVRIIHGFHCLVAFSLPYDNREYK